MNDKSSKYRKAHKEKITQYQSAWRAASKIKRRAHDTVRRALKKGTIEKPLQCCECHKICATEAHHEDYSRPLFIMWLCRKCHHSKHLGPLQIASRKQVPRKGEQTSTHKLKEKDVISIRALWSAGGNSKRAIARAFKVTEGTIRLIINGKLWKYLL